VGFFSLSLLSLFSDALENTGLCVEFGKGKMRFFVTR